MEKRTCHFCKKILVIKSEKEWNKHRNKCMRSKFQPYIGTPKKQKMPKGKKQAPWVGQ